MASVTLLLSIFVWGVPLGSVAARSRLVQNPVAQAPLVEASPTVAPFQHVRFCLHYPAECKSDATENERIELIVQNLEFLNFVRIDRTFRIGHVDHVFPARSADARSRIERALRESGLPEWNIRDAPRWKEIDAYDFPLLSPYIEPTAWHHLK